ncbi:cyclic pyranopterin monophosphate synthase MoaC [Wukongibacter baidiensis]|uniref:cyclic pyranopterin monophosphate synthase MoaC n=1 Tax=Wukongibacter baidiensis TaxID=1723361 RepID=UPI003D7F6DA6
MEFTHFNESGKAKMVEVGDKNDTKRVAIARGTIKMNSNTLKMIIEGQMKKGDVLSVAQVAGIMGAKKTSEVIPMCHNIFITGADIRFEIDEENNAIHIESEVKTIGKTGIEMEALNSVSTTALTIYDMCKAVDKDMVIENIRLVKKTGGKSGEYIREGEL